MTYAIVTLLALASLPSLEACTVDLSSITSPPSLDDTQLSGVWYELGFAATFVPSGTLKNFALELTEVEQRDFNARKSYRLTYRSECTFEEYFVEKLSRPGVVTFTRTDSSGVPETTVIVDTDYTSFLTTLTCFGQASLTPDCPADNVAYTFYTRDPERKPGNKVPENVKAAYQEFLARTDDFCVGGKKLLFKETKNEWCVGA